MPNVSLTDNYHTTVADLKTAAETWCAVDEPHHEPRDECSGDALETGGDVRSGGNSDDAVDENCQSQS